MATRASPNNGEMPTEIDFSKGTRGKFTKPGATLKLPAYLNADVQTYLSVRADTRDFAIDQLVDELLKRYIEIPEAVRLSNFSGEPK